MEDPFGDDVSLSGTKFTFPYRCPIALYLNVLTRQKKSFFSQVIDLPMQKFCLAIENQIEAIFNDAFPANSLGGQWPMPMGVAPPKDTTTPYGNDESTVCLTEIMDGSTARATFARTSALSGSQSILHVYGDRTKKARV